jgi:flagellar export protein FliJ
MADLTALIRLHKFELDEKRITLGELYSALALLEREKAALESALALEKKAVDAGGDIHFTFLLYVERVRQQRQGLDHREDLLNKQIEKAKDSLMETFGELKKYEMTQEERERLAGEERRLKESRELDAIGLETFRRKGEE